MKNVVHMKFDDVLQRLLYLSSVLPGMRIYRSLALHLIETAPLVLVQERDPTTPLSVRPPLPWPSPIQLEAMLADFVMENVAGHGRKYGFSGVRFVPQVFDGAVRRVEFLGKRGLRREVGASSAAAYVQSVARQAQVPTRLGNVHDFANALTWAALPVSKWCIFCALYEDYAEFFAQDEARACRGRGRGIRSDRLTNLDEAGVVSLPGVHEVFLGHALLEHLLESRDATIYAPQWFLHEGVCPSLLTDAARHLSSPSNDPSRDCNDRDLDARFADALQEFLRGSSLEPGRAPFVLEPQLVGCRGPGIEV